MRLAQQIGKTGRPGIEPHCGLGHRGLADIEGGSAPPDPSAQHHKPGLRGTDILNRRQIAKRGNGRLQLG